MSRYKGGKHRTDAMDEQTCKGTSFFSRDQRKKQKSAARTEMNSAGGGAWTSGKTGRPRQVVEVQGWRSRPASRGGSRAEGRTWGSKTGRNRSKTVGLREQHKEARQRVASEVGPCAKDGTYVCADHPKTSPHTPKPVCCTDSSKSMLMDAACEPQDVLTCFCSYHDPTKTAFIFSCGSSKEIRHMMISGKNPEGTAVNSHYVRYFSTCAVRQG